MLRLSPEDNVAAVTTTIEAGEYVRTHNLASDYLPTYTLDEPSPG